MSKLTSHTSDFSRPPKKPPYKTIKTSLISIVRNKIIIDKITNIVIATNKIMIHTLQFLKLYLVYLYDTSQMLPKLDQSFILSIMKVICKPSPFKSGPKPKEETIALEAILSSFYQEHYQSFMHEELIRINLNNILGYLADNIVTMYENNIKQHFCEYVERFINILGQKKTVIESIKNDKNLTAEQKKSEINQHKSDLED